MRIPCLSYLFISVLKLVNAENCQVDKLPTQEGFQWDCEFTIDMNEAALGTQCRLQCNEGKDIRSNIVTFCTQNGWTEFTPPGPEQEECTASGSCYNIVKDQVYFGQWKCTNHLSEKCTHPKEGSTCELTCDPGFHHFSRKVSVCTNTGWDPSISDFKCLSCAPPVKPKNGKFSCDMGTDNKTYCLLHCDDHFRPEGPSFTSCSKDSDYDPPLEQLKCRDASRDYNMLKAPTAAGGSADFEYDEDKDCSSLDLPDFGRFECEGPVCRLICDEGYATQEVVTAVCSDGHWCTNNPGMGCKPLSNRSDVESEPRQSKLIMLDLDELLGK